GHPGRRRGNSRARRARSGTWRPRSRALRHRRQDGGREETRCGRPIVIDAATPMIVHSDARQRMTTKKFATAGLVLTLMIGMSGAAEARGQTQLFTRDKDQFGASLDPR